MATTIIKRKIGVEDINFDADGTGAREPVPKSDGGTRTVRRVSAIDIPLTTLARQNVTGSGSAMASTDVDGAIIELGDELNLLGAPDASTLVNTAGTLAVGTLVAANIGTDAVETAKIKALAVDNSKLAADSVSGSGASGVNKVEALSIAKGDLAADCIDGSKVEDDAIAAEHIAANAVQGAALDMGSGIGPSHFIFAAGLHTFATSTGKTTYIYLTGLAEADLVFTTFRTTEVFANSYGYDMKAIVDVGAGYIKVQFVTTPKDCEIYFQVLRAITT